MSYLRQCGHLVGCAAFLLAVTSAIADDKPVGSQATTDEQASNDNQASNDKQAQAKISRRQPTRFLRVRRDEFKSPVSLQTASVRYILPTADGKNELEVVLESVIHVGDRSYYREFNRRFRHYDAVLYELVAPPEKLIPDLEEERPHPLRILQRVTAEGLGFSSQIEEIDYEAANMVHSDLSPTELAEVTKGRGDDQITMLLETFTDMLRKKNIENTEAPDSADDPEATDDPEPNDDAPNDPEPNDDEPEATDDSDDGDGPKKVLSLRVLSDPEGAVKIRRLLASGFDKSPSLESMLRPSQQATLIKARNKRALEVFQEQLDAGKRRIALFWGAGHMADFERELVLTYGLQPAAVVWRDAWDLRDGAVEFSPLESILEKSLRGSLKDAVKGFLRNNEDGNEP